MSAIEGSWKQSDFVCSGKLNLDELQKAYQEWSENYDEDYTRLKYNGPAQAAKKLAELMPDKNKRILDVACGTGMVGTQLRSHGFVNIDGVDLVQDMLNQAEQTGVYSKLDVCDVMGKGIPCDNDVYDAIVCVGSFNQGYVSQAVFPEFCRVAKKGCIIMIVMREAYVYDCPDFRNGRLDMAISMLAQNGTWKYVLRERTQEYVGDFTGLIYVMEAQEGLKDPNDNFADISKSS